MAFYIFDFKFVPQKIKIHIAKFRLEVETTHMEVLVLATHVRNEISLFSFRTIAQRLVTHWTVDCGSRRAENRR